MNHTAKLRPYLAKQLVPLDSRDDGDIANASRMAAKIRRKTPDAQTWMEFVPSDGTPDARGVFVLWTAGAVNVIAGQDEAGQMRSYCRMKDGQELT